MTTLLHDIARVVDCEHKTAPRTEGEPYGYSIGTREVRDGRIKLTAAKPIDRQAFEEWTRRAVPAPGNLIFSREAPMGEVGEVPRQARVALGQRTVLVQIESSQVSHRYVKYRLMAPDTQLWIKRHSAGSTVLHINVSDVKRIPLGILPDLLEQERIVEVLEDHLSRLSAGSAYLNAAKQRVRVLTKSVLNALIPDVADYPAAWESTTVSKAGTVELGRQRHPDWHTGQNMHPYLRVANVFEDRIDTTDLMEMHWPGDTFDRFRLEPDDILLNEGQSPEWLGRPAIYRGVPEDVGFTNSLVRFKAREDVLPEFALLVFRRHMHTGRFRQESRITTNIAHLSATRLKKIEFPVPPIDEQRSIVETAALRLDGAKRLEVEIARSENRAQSLRRSLLSYAFSGQFSGASGGPGTEAVEEPGDEIAPPVPEGALS
ncbi:restriction endonuclease subunit S [Streptomyces sp. NPDC056491]|uniref:restriction endonuclease subunit S n=1 Tax=Streptomyces sp. NPDC056491 TaxID=3345837 RepID=UPI00369BB8B7